MFEFLIDNIFPMFGGYVFQQTVSIIIIIAEREIKGWVKLLSAFIEKPHV
jgi:hypothetical protein